MDRLVRGSNQSGLRAHNERLVLTLIRENGPLAKAEIARITGLSPQAVSVIIRRLESDGLLAKGNPIRGRVGKPSVPINLKADGALFFGLKVGRRSLDLVLADFLGHIKGRVHLTHRYPNPDGVVRFANDAVGQLLYQLSPEEQLRVAGLGIAMPFRLWQWARPLGVRQSDMDAWRGRDIRSELSELLDWPVYLQNDASAACSAELVFGSSEKPSNFLYFFIGFFVGGGLVIGNKVFTGATGNAAALGSLPVVVKNNKIQQLIDLASLATLENAISNSGGDGNSIWKSTSFWNIPGNTLNDWLDQAASGLAAASVTAACVLDFECAFVDGWLSSEVKTRLVEFANQKIKTMALAGIDTPQIREGAIGSEARSLGAASLPLSDRFLVDRDSRLNGS